jgi:PAS domain S-box-containing protein
MSATGESHGMDTGLLAAIVACCGDAVIAQTLDGIVVCWNEAAERLLGWSAEDMLGHPASIVVPEGHRLAERAVFDRLRGGARVVHAETARLHRDGSLVPVTAAFWPIRRAAGMVGVASLLLDPHEYEEAAWPADAVREASDRTTTLLLVEDDESMLELLQETLSHAGHRVIAASDGRTALGLLQMHPEVSAVVSDIVMPNGVSGLLLAREAQRLRPHIPVLLMSGHSPEEIGRLGSTEGFPFLVKPFRPDELTQHVRQLLS